MMTATGSSSACLDVSCPRLCRRRRRRRIGRETASRTALGPRTRWTQVLRPRRPISWACAWSADRPAAMRCTRCGACPRPCWRSATSCTVPRCCRPSWTRPASWSAPSTRPWASRTARAPSRSSWWTASATSSAAAIGPLPRQHGMLAVMLHDPQPQRLADIRADPRFRWWPRRTRSWTRSWACRSPAATRSSARCSWPTRPAASPRTTRNCWGCWPRTPPSR